MKNISTITNAVINDEYMPILNKLSSFIDISKLDMSYVNPNSCCYVLKVNDGYYSGYLYIGNIDNDAVIVTFNYNRNTGILFDSKVIKLKNWIFSQNDILDLDTHKLYINIPGSSIGDFYD